jgi:DNA polymerase III delta prime subunit
MEPINTVWTEKYRPRKVSDMVGDFKNKILKYLENPNAIPHFLFYSKTPGTGKCLVGSELFFCSDGLLSFDEYCELHDIEKKYTDLKDDVFCPENGLVNTQYFYKAKSKTVTITTKRGYEIEGTPNHKIKVFNNNGLIWKCLSDIDEKDYIPIIFNTNVFNRNKDLNYSRFNSMKRKYDNCSIKIKKPKKINNDIAYLAGVYIANGLYDGNRINISTHKEWLQERLLKIAKDNFNIKGHYIMFDNKRVGISFTSVWFSRFFEFVLNIERKTSRQKQIPLIVRNSDKDVQMNFINGLFEDAWISKEGYIELSTASKYLAKQLQIMLLNLGFFTTKRKKYLEKYSHFYHTLTFSVEHSKKFINYFNGVFKNEKIKFKKNMNTNVLSYKNIIKDYIKNQRKQNNIKKTDVYNLGLAKLNKKITGRISKVINNLSCFIDKEPYLDELNNIVKLRPYLDTIVKKEYSKEEKMIYDFHIPKTHSFLASGIINHNTTLAKAIINELECDSLILNSSDDRKIEVIREKVKQFAVTKSSKVGKRRCVFLDEFDGMLKASQEALRNIMETYASNVFFILTCNNINKVIEPLKSRCQLVPFAYPKKEEILVYLTNICNSENMEHTQDGLKKLVDIHYPSIRNCVLALQDLNTLGQAVSEDTVKPINELYLSLWKKLMEKDWKYIKENVLSSTIDPRELNTYFWENAVKSNDIKLIQLCCRNERDFANGADPKVIFVTGLIEMVK